MTARLEPCHDTALLLASAGYRLRRYAPPFGLWLRHTASLPVAICCGTDARSARLCTTANTRLALLL